MRGVAGGWRLVCWWLVCWWVCRGVCACVKLRVSGRSWGGGCEKGMKEGLQAQQAGGAMGAKLLAHKTAQLP